MAKEGSTISGFADAFAQAISYALQYGVPLQVLVDKFSHARFEPSGMTKNPEIRFAKSIVDYVFRWMAAKFLSAEAKYARRPQRARTDGGHRRRGGPAGDVAAAGRLAARQAGTRGVRGDAEPGRRTAVLDLRLDHGPQRRVLQVRQLRHDERLRLGRAIVRSLAGLRVSDRLGRGHPGPSFLSGRPDERRPGERGDP